MESKQNSNSADKKKSGTARSSSIPEGFKPRFYIGPEDLEKDIGGGLKNKGDWYLKGIRKPKLFRMSLLTEVGVTSPDRENRRRAVFKIYRMYEEAMILANCQRDLFFAAGHSEHPDGHMCVVTDNSGRTMPKRGCINRLEKSIPESAFRALEYIALFGNHDDTKELICRTLPSTRRGIEALRRIAVDGDAPTNCIALARLNACCLSPDTSDDKVDMDTAVTEGSIGAEARLSRTMANIERLAMRIESARRLDGMRHEAQIYDIALEPHDGQNALSLLRSRFLDDVFESDARRELRRGGRHATNRNSRIDAVEALLRIKDFEGLASVVMRGEYADARGKAVDALASSYESRKDRDMWDRAATDYDSSKARHWLHYAIRRSVHEDTANRILDMLLMKHDYLGVVRVIVFSKCKSVRERAHRELLVNYTIDNDSVLSIIASNSKTNHAERALMSLAMSALREGDETVWIRRALKRPSPKIGRLCLEMCRRLDYGKKHSFFSAMRAIFSAFARSVV